MEKALPSIPAKRYFTIGEVSELCGVKPYVLRYWEQEFTQLKPMKRRGNRRYYQHHEVLLIRRIRELLYDHGFTISGARNRLADAGLSSRSLEREVALDAELDADLDAGFGAAVEAPVNAEVVDMAAALIEAEAAAEGPAVATALSLSSDRAQLRAELLSIRELLTA
jgi:DNA-binding transcriptional MerR regulator